MPLFLEEPQYPTGRWPESAAVGDFNGDGKSDLVTAGSHYDFDNTVSVLLGNGDGTFQALVDYPTGYGPSSVAVGDFNGDGNPDLAVTNSVDSTVSVLLGLGGGTFQVHVDYPTGALPSSVAVADFNGDGKPDLAVTNHVGGTVSILLGRGDGTFQAHVDYVTGNDGYSVAVGDFNRDGKPDLAVANPEYSNYTVSVLLGNGDGTFQSYVGYPTGGAPQSVAVGDFNGDGKPDLVTVNSDFWNNSVSVLLGNGDGSFQSHVDYPTGGAPQSVAVEDFNGDGKPDLVTANSLDDSVSLLQGNGDGTFETRVDYPTGSYPESVALGDFNGDGEPDLATANSAGWTVSVLLGNGDGTFKLRPQYCRTGSSPLSLAVADFNGDGNPDLAVGNSGNTLSVLLGNGDGTFQTHVDYPTGDAPQSVAVGDFNGDGKPDVATANGVNSITVLLGNGDGVFQGAVTYTVENSATSVTVGDFNADGKLDLAVANADTCGIFPDLYYCNGKVSVLLGNADGTFQTHVDYPTGDWQGSVAMGDFNRDGKPDLVAANLNSCSTHHLGTCDANVAVLLGNGDGTFQPHVDYGAGSPAWSVAVGDFNGDSKLDLAVSNAGVCGTYYYCNPQVSVLLGNGDGTFQAHVDYPTGDFPRSVAVADFNGDGKPDLATANEGNSVSVLLGNGDGTFQASMEYARGQAGYAATIADFNKDGTPDLAVLTPINAVTILLNIRGAVGELQSSANPSALGQPVALTATIHASLSDVSLAAPTGSVTFLDGTNELGRQTLDADGVATFATTALAAGTHSIAAVYSGDGNFNPHTVLVSQVVNAQDFGVSAAPGSATLKSGASTSFAIAVAPINGFGQVVSLTCSVSPTPALAPTCALSPASVMPTASGSAIANLTVATTGVTASMIRPLFRYDWQPLYALWLPISSLTLMGVGLARGRTGKKKTILGILLTGLLLIALGPQSACGGSSSRIIEPGSPGTPPGTYTVTVSAVSGSTTHTTKVTLTVQ